MPNEDLYSPRMVATKRKIQINKQQTTHTHTHTINATVTTSYKNVASPCNWGRDKLCFAWHYLFYTFVRILLMLYFRGSTFMVTCILMLFENDKMLPVIFLATVTVLESLTVDV